MEVILLYNFRKQRRAEMCPGSTIITDASEAVFSNTSLLSLPLLTFISDTFPSVCCHHLIQIA